MKSARYRYQNDATYKALVDMMEAFIHRCEFTPSELREASILASIGYDVRRVRCSYVPMTDVLHQQLEHLNSIINSAQHSTADLAAEASQEALGQGDAGLKSSTRKE